MMRFFRLVAALLVASLCACGGTGDPKLVRRGESKPAVMPEDDTPVAPPENEKITLPETPRGDAWVPFTTVARETSTFAVDSRSLTIMPWGEVRYTLRIMTATSLETVRYEGIMCGKRTWRPLAFLQENGTWSEARDPKWLEIHQVSQNDFHHALYRDYLCDFGRPRKVAEMIQEMKKPLHMFETTH